jgi:uncharacterized membrane protein YphA (DoxX/SURF4 family)
MVTEYIFLLGRVLFGGFFIVSGYGHFKNLSNMAGYAASKKVPMPKLSVGFSGLLLLLGGLGVLLGVWVPYALGCLVLFLVPTTFMVHNYWTDTDQNAKMANRINFNKNLALLGAALIMYMVATPWPYSLIK